MMPGATSAWSLIDLPKLPEGTSSLASLDWSFIDLYPLPEGCKERLQNALASTVGGLVNGLEASNVEQYLKLLQNVYNIPAEDFDTLEEKVRDAVKSGPRLHVACKRARLPGFKRENLKLVAFIQGKEDNLLEVELGNLDLTSAEKKELSLDLVGELPLPKPGVEVCLRVELRKAKSEKIAAHSEIQLSDISGSAHTRWCQLQTRDRRFSLLSPHKEDSAEQTDGVNEVEIELCQTNAAPHCSEEVPRLLAEFLQERAERILQLKFEKLVPVASRKEGIFSLHVDRMEGRKRKETKRYFQAVTRSPGNQKETDLDISEFSLDCIVTNVLELGRVSKRASIPSGGGGMGSQESIISSIVQSPPFLRNQSRASLTHLPFSPSKAKEEKREVPVMELLESLWNQQPVPVKLSGREEEVTWHCRIQSRDQITLQDLKALYLNGLIAATAKGEKSLANVSSLLKLLHPVTLGSGAEVEEARSEAFLEAKIFLSKEVTDLLSFGQLTKHLSILLSKDGVSDTISKYKAHCLDQLVHHRNVEKRKDLGVIVEQLKMFNGGREVDEELRAEVGRRIEKAAENLFQTWKEEFIQNQNGGSPKKVNQFVLCRFILIETLGELTSGGDTFQRQFQGLVDYQQTLGNQLVKLCQRELKSQKPAFNNSNVPLAYDCYRAFRRVANALGCECSQWLYDQFKEYQKPWMEEVPLKKAKSEVKKLIGKMEGLQQEVSQVDGANGVLKRQDSVDDSSNTVLRLFHEIAESCWKARKELDWPNMEDNLTMCCKIIEEFAKYEREMFEAFDKFSKKNKDYNVHELARGVKLLNKMAGIHKTEAENVLDLYHSKKLENEVDLEYLRQKTAECTERLEKLRTQAKEQIHNTFQFYCEHVRPKIKEKIKRKMLTEGQNHQESLLNFIYDESDRILDNLKESHPNDRSKIRINPEDVVRKLWETVEEELEKKFAEKKERNRNKNKPSRFNHYKELRNFLDASKDLRLKGDVIPLKTVRQSK